MNPLFWQYAGIFGVSLAAVVTFFWLWGRREERRYWAGERAKTLAAWGFELLAKLLTAYSVGNYFGKNSVTRVLHEIIDELRGEGLLKMLRKVGWKVVEGVFLNDEDDRARLTELLARPMVQRKEPTPPPPELPEAV